MNELLHAAALLVSHTALMIPATASRTTFDFRLMTSNQTQERVLEGSWYA